MSKQKAYQFFRLTEAMRAKQIEYFKTRDPRALEESKKLEHQIDAIIKETNDILNGTKPLSLDFNPPLQKYIVLGRNPEDGTRYAFNTDWYNYDNHYDEKQEMAVIDLDTSRVSFNGKDWEEIEEDHL